MHEQLYQRLNQMTDPIIPENLLPFIDWTEITECVNSEAFYKRYIDYVEWDIIIANQLASPKFIEQHFDQIYCITICLINFNHLVFRKYPSFKITNLNCYNLPSIFIPESVKSGFLHENKNMNRQQYLENLKSKFDNLKIEF